MVKMLLWVLQFCLGLLVANAGEWFIHRYLLHGLGKNPGSFWAYHICEHHHIAWKLSMLDPGYKKWPTCWNSQAKELLVLFSILILNTPFFWLLNGYAWGIYVSVIVYYFLHRHAHCHSGWAKIYLPWHYQHHLINSDANWCITHPLFDYLMKRVKYVYARDLESVYELNKYGFENAEFFMDTSYFAFNWSALEHDKLKK